MAVQRGLGISTNRLLRGATSVSVRYVVSRSNACVFWELAFVAE